MTMSLFGIFQTAGSGLRVHRTWLDAVGDNIANINTPRFLAGRVQFEDALASAVASGDTSATVTSIARSLEPTREDGNNVNLESETLSNIDTGMRYSLMLRAADHQFGILRASMRTT